jgi:hypothetical protein
MQSLLRLSHRHRLSAVNPGDIFDVFLCVAGCAFLIFCMIELNVSRPDMLEANLLLGLNGTLSIVGSYVALRLKFPIIFIIFYFDYIFFSVAPLQQIRAMFDPIFENDTYLFSAIAQCLLFSVLALGVTLQRNRSRFKRRSSNSFLSRSIMEPKTFQPHALFIVTALVITGLLVFYGSSLLTSRESFGNFLESRLDKSTGLLVISFLNPFAFIAAVIGLRATYQSRSWHWLILFGVLLIAALFIVNPLVTARFRLSALLLFGVLVFAGWNNTRVIALSVVAGLIISPLFNSFRTDLPSSDIRGIDTFFAHMDYDGLTIMCYAVYYVAQVGYSYGLNILSGLLFFVPRSFWVDKSEHVTHYLFPYLEVSRGLTSDNLSSPIPSEGYFAFGIVGTVIFTMVVLKALATIECRAETSDDNSPWKLIACVSPMLTMILLRGPFLVGYSEFWGYVLAIVAAASLTRIKLFNSLKPKRANTRAFT